MIKTEYNISKLVLNFILVFLLFIDYYPSNAQLIEYDTSFKVSPNVNSSFEESYPLISPDQTTLYYVRSLSDKNVRGKLGGQDIWFTKKDEKGNWSIPANKLYPLNTKGNNAIVGFNAQGNRVYLLNTYKKGFFLNKGISYSELKNGRWTSPTPIELNNFNPRSLFYGFYMHPSENYLLVSMDAEGSLGQEDLYVILKEQSGEWGEPIHLGNTINTPGYEIAPFLSEDGTTLFFSSNGHDGLGSADIYMSKRLYQSWNIWTKPVNLGSRINSPKFDAYFSLTKDSTIYFTSNRDGQLSDIYQSKMIKKDIKDILDIEDTKPSEAFNSGKKLQKVSEKETNKILGVSIPRVVYFDINSFEINPADKELIYYIAGKIENEKNYSLEIVGHTDQEGNEAYNKELSLKRAEAVKRQFSALGIPPSRIITVGKGSTQPAVKDHSSINKKNRRVEINFLK